MAEPVAELGLFFPIPPHRQAQHDDVKNTTKYTSPQSGEPYLTPETDSSAQYASFFAQYASSVETKLHTRTSQSRQLRARP